MINTCNSNIKNKNKKLWSDYNKSLVNRVVILLDLSVLEKWETLIEKENRNKFGRPYEYPIEFFEFLMKIRVLYNVPFRNLESFVKILSEITGKFKPLTYVAIFKRIRSLSTDKIFEEINGNVKGERDLEIIVDSTGFKITKRGEWINEKYGKKRKGWLKLHVAIDSKSINVLNFEITGEHVHDSEKLESLLKPLVDKTKVVYGDKGYDSRKIHNFLNSNGIEGIIMPRKNAVTKSKGSPGRAKIVREIKKKGEDEWKRSVDYGKRWRVEIFFSGLKRVMGEILMAKKLEYLIQELMFKVYSYFIMRINTVGEIKWT